MSHKEDSTKQGEATSASSTPVQPPYMPFAAPMQGILPPSKLCITGNIAEHWKAYKQVWENYSIITGLASKPEEYKVALFLHCIGTDALRIYNGLPFNNEIERKNLEAVMKRFERIHNWGDK